MVMHIPNMHIRNMHIHNICSADGIIPGRQHVGEAIREFWLEPALSINPRRHDDHHSTDPVPAADYDCVEYIRQLSPQRVFWMSIELICIGFLNGHKAYA